MNVILTGLRGTGKSSLGRLVAHKLHCTFVDTDTLLEEQAKARIADIVAQHGWEHFRTLERQVVEIVASRDHQIVAAGGGTLMDPENTRRLKQNGVIVLLLCELPILQRRLAFGSNRPSLTGQGSAGTELAHVWEERRERYYEVANLTYDVSSESDNMPDDLEHKAQTLVAMLEQFPHFHRG